LHYGGYVFLGMRRRILSFQIIENLINFDHKLKKMNTLLERITINSETCHGKPIIRETRYTVESIIEYLAGGDSVDDILKEFHDLERDDILACLAYAAQSMRFKDIIIPAA
jgi:uncharacterized protein (DUF433 family)